MYNSMIVNQKQDAIDPPLRFNQNGFRKGRSALAQILALRRIIKEVKKNNPTSVGHRGHAQGHKSQGGDI